MAQSGTADKKYNNKLLTIKKSANWPVAYLNLN